VRNRAPGIVFGQAHGPQSKGVGQWQLKHAMQGEFAAKNYYEIILDHFSTELGQGGHELP
jgi:hypothetical protein